MTDDATTPPDFRLIGQEYDAAVPVDSVTPHPDNVNAGDVEFIAGSIDEHGFFGAVMVQRSSRRIIWGEHRWRAAVARGARTLPMFLADVDDDTARRIMLIDNEATRKGKNRPDDLARLLQELEQAPRGLTGTGFGTDDLAALLADLEASGQPEPVRRQVEFEAWDGHKPTKPTAEWGDLWTVGEHRIVCGDSFDPDFVGLLTEGTPVDLVVCDPPYAIYGSATGIASDIADDAMVRPFFREMWRTIHGVLEDFGHAYVCCDWRSYPAMRETSKGTGMDPKNCIVWDKGGAGLGSNYANTHEFVAFHARIPPSGAMTGSRKTGQRPVFASNVMRHNRPTGDDRQHNAAKPVPLLRDLITNSSEPGQRVLDLFAGSGSTALAAIAEERVALCMEKEPGMVDVIVRRLEKATGLTAARTPMAVAG